jgi:ABC-2 type transport system permease protein
MKTIVTIGLMDLKRLFVSPLAWITLALALFILAWIFLLGVDEYLTQVKPMSTNLDDPPGISALLLSALYSWAGMIMLAIMPLLTMRQLAEERMQQTLVLLKAAPISNTKIVLGKYLSSLIFIVIFILLLGLMPLSLVIATALDWGQFFAANLGLFLLLASFAAAGLFLSSLTRQAISAAVLTFGFLLFLLLLYISGNSQNTASNLFIYLSHYSHFLSFQSGLFDTSDIAYYCLFIISFIVLTIKKLENERLRG